MNRDNEEILRILAGIQSCVRQSLSSLAQVGAPGAVLAEVADCLQRLESPGLLEGRRAGELVVGEYIQPCVSAPTEPSLTEVIAEEKRAAREAIQQALEASL